MSDMITGVRVWLRNEFRRSRMRLGSWVMGGDWLGVVGRLWLVRDRALAAVTSDGHVTLAECRALADVLYEPIPGEWKISVTRVYPMDDPILNEEPVS